MCSVEPNVEPELNDRPTQAVNVTAVAGSWSAPTPPQGSLLIHTYRDGEDDWEAGTGSAEIKLHLLL